MTKAKQEEIIIRALKCYQKELTNQISFHNSVGRPESLHRALIGELYKVEDILDPMVKRAKKPVRKRK